MLFRLKLREPNVEIGGSEDPYLRRWHVIPRNRFFNIYLHEFCKSDEDRALHDHPWWSASIILRGRYIEHFKDAPFRVRSAGQIGARRATTAHRIQLFLDKECKPAHCWTLFITGPVVREWGFHCPQGWRHWRKFVTGGQGELIGRGCD